MGVDKGRAMIEAVEEKFGSDHKSQVEKAIQAEEDAKMRPREVIEANERVAKQMHRAYLLDLFITCLSWSGWLVVAIMIIKGC